MSRSTDAEFLEAASTGQSPTPPQATRLADAAPGRADNPGPNLSNPVHLVPSLSIATPRYTPANSVVQEWCGKCVPSVFVSSLRLVKAYN